MKRALLLLTLLALPLAAQDKSVEPLVNTAQKPAADVQKLIMLKYVDPQQIVELLRVFNAAVIPNSSMHALAVRATPDVMAAIEDAIKRLDVPSSAPKNIDLTVYLLMASETDVSPGGVPLPKEMDSVVTQLKSAFAFKNYSLLDVLALRTRTGQSAQAESTSALQFPAGPRSVITDFQLRSATVGTDGTTIRIDNMRSNTKIPVAQGGGNDFTYQNLGMQTDVDIKEGQKVVVGRIGISRDQALFQVLIAKIIE